MYHLHGYALLVYLLVAGAVGGGLWVAACVSLAREEARSKRLRARVAAWVP